MHQGGREWLLFGAPLAAEQVRPKSAKNPTIAQGNSPDCTNSAPKVSAMTARAQSQATKATPQVFHDLAENSVARAKENFEKMNAAAGEATSQMKDTYSVTFKGVQDYHTKVLEFAHANINAAFEHARKLSSVRSPAEFFSLSNDHLRQQFEILSRQAQELAAIAQKMTAATTESIKAGVQKVA
jgi:phasin